MKYKVDDPWANRIRARHVITRNYLILQLTAAATGPLFKAVSRALSTVLFRALSGAVF
jgi:hypothetical protein